MQRREFLAAFPSVALGQPQRTGDISFNALAETAFLEILRGYVKHTARTSDSYSVVEYPEATVTKNFLSNSGLSATGVTRMLPALAAWIVSRRQPAILHIDGKQYDLLDVAGSALVHGTDPNHKDYWGASPADAQNQRQVESSIVAWTAWVLRDTLLPQMSSVERRRLDEWLASCTKREVRRNNWAWFTAVNIGARMALKDKFDEFTFDQSFMFDDLRALDGMYVGKGWYNDDKPRQAFDYYNSWVFASHFLYWNAMVGSRFAEWAQVFSARLKEYLETAPFFFGANGSHVLYGRSLIYRFGVLTPLVLAYTQKLWPHDAGLLQRIVRGNLEFHRATNGFDSDKGKLRETYSDRGTIDIHESYIDGGHPYWGMQAFAMWLIAREDPFWSGDASPLPVERTGFVLPIEQPGMILAGHRDSGHVKLLQARSTKTDFHYRDKYNKLVYSTHFPFNIVQRAEICPWDNALVLRDTRRRRSTGRGEIEEMRMLPDGFEIAYSLSYGGLKASVRTTLHISGEFELRIHRVIVPAEIDPGMELAEGSSALGLHAFEDADFGSHERFSIVRNRKTGMLIGSWPGTGWTGVGAAHNYGTSDSASSNIIYPMFQVNTLWTALKPGAQILTSVHYASPKPVAHPALHQAAAKLLARVSSPAARPAPVRTKPAAAAPKP
jgi:hypothetical protein